MAHRPLKKGDRVLWGDYPGEVAATHKRRGEAYLLMPSADNASGGHWLPEVNLELAAELSGDDIAELIELICTVDGQTRGKSPPHPASVHGRIHAKLLRMREATR